MKTPMQELINELDFLKEGLNGQNVNLIVSIQDRIKRKFIQKEKSIIIDSYNKSGKKSTTIANNLLYASSGIKDTFYHEDAEGETYYNELTQETIKN